MPTLVFSRYTNRIVVSLVYEICTSQDLRWFWYFLLDWKHKTNKAVFWCNRHGGSSWLWICGRCSWCGWCHCDDETFDWQQQSIIYKLTWHMCCACSRRTSKENCHWYFSIILKSLKYYRYIVFWNIFRQITII